MVARGAGAIGCAHCKRIGADQACQICTRQVCPTCAADWATCEAPSGRVVRLGLTARVRDVDPNGRLALVSHWRRPLRLFDLRALRWIGDVRIPRSAYVWNRSYPPRLTSDGRLLYPDWSVRSGYERNDDSLFSGIRTHLLHAERSWLTPSHPPQHGTAVTPTGDLYYYVTATQRVAVIQSRQSQWPLLVEPLPRKVIHAAHLDAARDLLATGSWCELVLHRIVGNEIERLCRVKTESTGEVRWLAIAGPWLAAGIHVGYAWRIEVRRVDADLSIGPIEHTHTGTLRAASLSRDGRYLALGLETGLLVHELGTDHITTFDEHTDRINYVRFAADDHVLISADTDNRIVMRPRTPQGYARPLIPIDIPEGGIPLPTHDPVRE